MVKQVSSHNAVPLYDSHQGVPSVADNVQPAASRTREAGNALLSGLHRLLPSRDKQAQTTTTSTSTAGVMRSMFHRATRFVIPSADASSSQARQDNVALVGVGKLNDVPVARISTPQALPGRVKRMLTARVAELADDECIEGRIQHPELACFNFALNGCRPGTVPADLQAMFSFVANNTDFVVPEEGNQTLLAQSGRWFQRDSNVRAMQQIRDQYLSGSAQGEPQAKARAVSGVMREAIKAHGLKPIALGAGPADYQVVVQYDLRDQPSFDHVYLKVHGAICETFPEMSEIQLSRTPQPLKPGFAEVSIPIAGLLPEQINEISMALGQR